MALGGTRGEGRAHGSDTCRDSDCGPCTLSPSRVRGRPGGVPAGPECGQLPQAFPPALHTLSRGWSTGRFVQPLGAFSPGFPRVRGMGRPAVTTHHTRPACAPSTHKSHTRHIHTHHTRYIHYVHTHTNSMHMLYTHTHMPHHIPTPCPYKHTVC